MSSLPYNPAPPDTEQVRLRAMEAQVDFTKWTNYSFHSHVLRATEGWSMTIGDGDLNASEREALVIGSRVRLFVQNVTLAEGYIDTIEIGAARGSGVTYQIHGRNRLGMAVDSIADPTLQIKEGSTLLDFLKAVFGPFGWAGDEDFEVDNRANRDAKTSIRGTPLTKGGKKKPPKPLKDFVLHQLKPHAHEGVYAFATRVTQRHGLWIWTSADGDKLIVAQPDFYQEPIYKLRRTFDGTTNVLDGTVTFDIVDQPSVIFADGYSGGGEYGMGRVKAFCVNPYFGHDTEGFVLPGVQELISKNPDSQQLVMTTQPFKRRRIDLPVRPLYLHDEESHTHEQLNNFVRREMSLLLRKSLVAHYTVEGHGQDIEGRYVAWDIDTVVDVQDDVAGVNERMYVIGRSLEKSRGGGTRTQLELVRLHSIQFGD